MLRVVLGRARPDTAWSAKVSGLEFNSSPGIRESARSRDATNTITMVPRTYNGEEVDLEASLEAKPESSGGEEMSGGYEVKART
jgi:hypothetical protein